MKKTIPLSEAFLSFEIEHKLFEIKDDSGFFIWDALRFDVYIELMWGSQSKINNTSFFLKAYRRLFMVLNYFKFILTKANFDNLFFLTSRNIHPKENKYFDINADATLNFMASKNNVLFETILDSHKNRLHKSNTFYSPSVIASIYNSKNYTYDFSDLSKLINTHFSTTKISTEFLYDIYNRFRFEYNFYIKVLKKLKIKNLFLTQNGIQKGLLKAANDSNIKVFEFQHGIVDSGHLAYNYPKINYSKNSIYLPNSIFSLGSFWFNELYLPNVNVQILGNDFFSKSVFSKAEEQNAITIVSSDFSGKKLMEFINIIYKDKPEECPKIFFKLHPNQFYEKEFYEKNLKKYRNIEIITTEFSINQLLELSHSILVIQSTAVYEALQAKRRVLILEEMTYYRHNHIFNHENVYIIKTKDEYFSALSSVITDKNVTFFEPCNQNILKNTFN